MTKQTSKATSDSVCRKSSLTEEQSRTRDKDGAARQDDPKDSPQQSTRPGFCIIEKIHTAGDDTPDFLFTEANAEYSKQFGASCKGKTVREVDPNNCEASLGIYNAVLQAGQDTTFVREVLAQQRLFEIHLFPISDENRFRIAVTSIDITERKRTEDLLHRNHDTLSNMIEKSPFGIYIVDSNFCLWQVSQASKKAFVNINPLIGANFGNVMHTLWHDDFANEAIRLFRHTLETGEPYASINMTEVRHDVMAKESYDWSIERIALPDGQWGVICYFYDLTERQRAQDALHQSVLELRETEMQLRLTQASLTSEKAALAEKVQQLERAKESLVITTAQAEALTAKVELARKEMAQLAQHDPLTKLPNRILLNDRIGSALALARRQGNPFAVLFLDLDRFKYINDTLGHNVGDQLLISVAKRLMANVRDTDTVCRLGGDEFVILLAEVEHTEGAARVTQEILKAVTLPYSVNQSEMSITASIGVSVFPTDGTDAEALINNADRAMYHAKTLGRNNYQFFRHEMKIRADERYSIQAGLRQALMQNEFVLHYQPKVNLESGAITGIEALVRWQHAKRGLILPEQFLWIAEDCGLMIPIGECVLRKACLQNKAWQDQGLQAIPIAVNVSEAQFKHQNFLSDIDAILKETELAAEYLELEMSESIFTRDVDSAVRLLKQLKNRGLRLAINNYGTGHSSLRDLSRFPIDTLKLDKSFMSDIAEAKLDAPSTSMLRAIISMAKNLHQSILAEGVETQDQVAFLRRHGCEEGQGFFLGRPLNAIEFIASLQTGVTHPPSLTLRQPVDQR